MYFANDVGLMSFDGSVWKKYPLYNQTVFRSLAISENGIIYGGGQNEFGKYEPNEKGSWIFHSLKENIPIEHQNFEDVWEMIILNEEIYFRASSKIYHFKDNQFLVYDSVPVDFLGESNGNVFIYSHDKGILRLDNGQYTLIEGTEVLANKNIVGFIASKDSILLATKEHGIFLQHQGKVQPWEISTNNFIIDNQIRSFTQLSNGNIGIGTIFGGLLIIDSSGQIVNHINKDDGLLSNSILSQFLDKNNNLWLGLDKGINHLQTNSHFTRIYPDGQLDGAGYAAAVFENQLYLGTNNGLYVRSLDKKNLPLHSKEFSLVKNSRGQTWGLNIIDDDLVLSHDVGAFKIKENVALALSPNQNNYGYWLFKKLNKNPNYIISGTYKGLSLFKKSGHQWDFEDKVSDLIESSRFVEEDRYGNIWVAHPYKGIYKISKNKDSYDAVAQILGQKDGLPTNFHNHLFKIKDEIIFCGEVGVYTYNYEINRFEPHTSFNDFFDVGTKIRRLVEAPNGDIWFITREDIGVLEIDDLGLDKKIRKKVFPELKVLLNAGFEFIYPYNNNVLISTEKGFIHYSPTVDVKLDPNLQIILNEILITNQNKEIIFSGHHFDGNNVGVEYIKQNNVFPHYSNAFSFSFSATSFSHSNLLLYRHQLEGFEENWSSWDKQKTKEYTNLPHGNYTFLIQAKDYQNTESPILRYSFSIAAPWYLTRWAFSLYALFFILATFLVIKRINKKYQSMEDVHEKIVQESQKEIDQLKNEKIELELEHKKRALVSSTLLLVQKNETLAELKELLIQIKKETKDTTTKSKINKLIHLLQQDEVLDEGWEQFMLHFNELHGDFLNRLRKSFPSLTPKDLKLCGYLRMNLSTKEIASLMNISTRGVEASRYRIRKKCDLDTLENLTEFLMEF